MATAIYVAREELSIVNAILFRHGLPPVTRRENRFLMNILHARRAPLHIELECVAAIRSYRDQPK